MVTLSESDILILHLAVDVKAVFDRGKKFRWLKPSRCPRCGSDDRNNYIHSVCPPRHEFHAACDFDGDYHPWHAAERIAVRFAGHRAGNVPTSFSQRQLDMEWNAAIETAAAIEGACCNTNAKKILCLRRPSP